MCGKIEIENKRQQCIVLVSSGANASCYATAGLVNCFFFIKSPGIQSALYSCAFHYKLYILLSRINKIRVLEPQHRPSYTYIGYMCRINRFSFFLLLFVAKNKYITESKKKTSYREE